MNEGRRNQVKSIRSKVLAVNALCVIGALVAAVGAPLKWG
jgi:hypothetical protein